MRHASFVYAFDRFELDPTTRWLTCDGERIYVSDSQFSILLKLVAHAPELVPTEELAKAGWSASPRDSSIRRPFRGCARRWDRTSHESSSKR
jgi:DNA-binding winged helix-turn-helix (wHTH) protein